MANPMSPKKWNDQPDLVMQATVLTRLFVEGAVIEVRKLDDGRYTLTHGTLFGSQTMLCQDADAVFAVQAQIMVKEKDRKVPAGVTVL